MFEEKNYFTPNLPPNWVLLIAAILCMLSAVFLAFAHNG